MIDYLAVAQAGDIEPGSMKSFDVAGAEVVIANTQDTFNAFSGLCTCIAHFVGHTDRD